MNKLLRTTMFAIMAMVSFGTFAQTTVTFTAGTDKGTLDNAGKAGDKVTKDGVTIETTDGNSAFAAAQYRFSKGSTTTFSSTVGNITKIEFTCTASGDAKYGPGCFTNPSAGSYSFSDKTGTWTGNAASFTLTASSNQVRATTIVVTIGDGGDTPVTPDKPTVTTTGDGTIANPYTVADANALKNALPSDTAYYTGTIKYIKSVDTGTYGNAEYSLSADGTTDTLLVYRGYYLEGHKFTNADQIKVGDKVIVKGKLIEYNGTLELGTRNFIYSLNGKTKDNTKVTPVDTLSYTVAQAVAVLTAGAETTNVVYVTGKISQIDEVNTSYGNATYYISDDGSTTGQLQVFRGKYLGNAKFSSDEQIKVGDEVKILGVLKNYESKGGDTTQEVQNSYIVSINGQTTGIRSVSNDSANNDSHAYNLAGQRVGKDYKGVVIKNGKKVIRK